MRFRAEILVISCVAAVALAGLPGAFAAAASKDGRVTQIFRDVKLLPSEAEARPAVVNDPVREGIAVRTGDQSRSELTFADLTINRLGANSIFSFNRAGRSVQLDAGSILLRVPKGSGGGNVRGPAVTVAITGTTVILETGRGGRSKLIVLEGGARLALLKNRSQSRDVRAGQMLDVPAGATTLPMPVDIDLDQVMKTHPLVTGFRPLPSRDLIADAARRQRPGGPGDEPVYDGRPVRGGPVAGGPLFPGINIPPFFGGGGNRGGGSVRNPPGTGGGTTGGGGKPDGPRGAGAVGLPTSGQATVADPGTSSGGGATAPILRRTPTRKIPVPRSTPSPIR